jgi:hypothetical protein
MRGRSITIDDKVEDGWKTDESERQGPGVIANLTLLQTNWPRRWLVVVSADIRPS